VLRFAQFGTTVGTTARIEINDAKDAAKALEPFAGRSASTLFGIGFLGAALLAAAVVPQSTAYSIAEAAGKPADIDDSFTGAFLALIAASVVTLGVLTVAG
jgi:Mn2+/Fe2+ NRAMP family transporter